MPHVAPEVSGRVSYQFLKSLLEADRSYRLVDLSLPMMTRLGRHVYSDLS